MSISDTVTNACECYFYKCHIDMVVRIFEVFSVSPHDCDTRTLYIFMYKSVNYVQTDRVENEFHWKL